MSDPDILIPFVVTTSGYNSPNVDWADPLIDPPVSAVICRASLGTPEWMGSVNNATDMSFPHYWPQFDRLHMLRGAYPFLENGAGGADQAQWFVNRVMAAGGFHPCDRIMLDVEQAANLSIKEILDFWTQFAVLVPYIPIRNYLLYSRGDLMNPLKFDKLTQAQRDFIKSIHQHPAGYPNDITGWDFAKLAHAYQYDPAKYGPVAMVQYRASATVPGISKPGYMSVECNAIDPAYLVQWQKDVVEFYSTAPMQDTVTTPYPGVRATLGRRFDTDIQVVEIAKAAIASAVIDYLPGVCRPIGEINGDVVTNGGDFDMTNCLPIGLLVSRGLTVSHQADSEPALGFRSDNVPEIDHQKTSWPNAVGLKRYLVVNGTISPNTSEAWLAREPRTIMGVKGNGDLVILWAKGRQDGQLGLDLFQAARTMLEFGTWTAADGDGGDSVQARISGATFHGTTTPRPVADFVSIVIKTGGIPMAKYKCTVTWDAGASIRPEPSTSNSGVGVYPDNAVFYASELLPDADSPADVTKQWAKVESDPVHGTNFAGKFVAVKYPGSTGAADRCLVEEIGPTPPPVGKVIDHIEVVYSDGTRQNFVPQV